MHAFCGLWGLCEVAFHGGAIDGVGLPYIAISVIGEERGTSLWFVRGLVCLDTDCFGPLCSEFAHLVSPV